MLLNYFLQYHFYFASVAPGLIYLKLYIAARVNIGLLKRA